MTEALRPGANRLKVRVDDSPERFPEIAHGKQSWYGMLSGIWQSVWLETRPELHVCAAQVTPDPATGRVDVSVTTSAPLPEGARFGFEIIGPDGRVVAEGASALPQFAVDVPAPARWDVDGPNLYRIRVSLDLSGDSIEEHFGFRTIETLDGRLLLNGRPLYLRAALDQDYYPERHLHRALCRVHRVGNAAGAGDGLQLPAHPHQGRRPALLRDRGPTRAARLDRAAEPRAS